MGELSEQNRELIKSTELPPRVGPFTHFYTFAQLCALLDAARSEGAPDISTDGPHEITDHRRWLARQLLDSKLDDKVAFGIVAYFPAVKSARSEAQPSGYDGGKSLGERARRLADHADSLAAAARQRREMAEVYLPLSDLNCAHNVEADRLDELAADLRAALTFTASLSDEKERG